MYAAARHLTTKLLHDFRGEILALPTRTILFAATVLLLVLPLLTRDVYLLRIATLTCIFALYAASWDLLAGFAGQMSFGHAMFFGVGAYAAALLNLTAGLPPGLSIPGGALAAVVAGLVLGVPGLRLRGPYFTLASLAFPVILTGLIFYFPDFTGGELGLLGVARLGSSRVVEYYLVLALMLALALGLWKVATSHTGVILHAIREDEIAVRASGINTTRYKLLAFCLSGLCAGVAGGLYAHFMRVVGPSTLEPLLSLQLIVWAIFGGMTTIYGPIIGVFILYPLMEYLRALPEYRMLLFAAIVVVALRFMPEGVSAWVQDRLERQCPRCKERNAVTRRHCRVCGAAMLPQPKRREVSR